MRAPPRSSSRWRLEPLLLGALSLGPIACGGAEPGAALAGAAPKSAAAEMVTPSRLIPDVVGTRQYVGEEGGARRVLADRMRVLARDDGSLERATEMLPAGSVNAVKLPSRFGGGYVFYSTASGSTHIWRAPSWLAKLEPLAELPFSTESITPGLDRLYVRQMGSGQLRGIDAQTGATMSTAPLPPAAAYGALAFADGWRGVAEVDLRGLVATFDAGATWRPLPITEHVNSVILAGGNPTVFVGRGSYVVDQNGSVTFRAPPPPEHDTVNPPPRGRAPSVTDALEKLAPPPPGPLGRRPLRAALEDGFPDVPGTAIVARGGAIARVSLRDGAVQALVDDAYPDRTASCHAVKVGAGWGFICGERDGASRVYEYAPPLAMKVVLSYSSPRFIAASGNGALVIRGACADEPAPASLGLLPDERPSSASASASASAAPAASAGPSASPSASGSATPSALAPRFGPVAATSTAYCVRSAAGATRDVRLKGDIAAERVVALADGRVAVLVPPHTGAAGQLVLLATSGAAQPIPLRMPTEPKAAARELHRGMWLEGFEERGKGLAGWVEAGGTTVGVTVGLDGVVKAGEPRDDVGGPLLAGRFGLSITDASRAAETTDGGFTWKSFELPERDEASVLATPTRGCTAVGCAFGGWLRVGWGEPAVPHDLATVENPHAPRSPLRNVTSLPFVCEVSGSAPQAAAREKPHAAAAAPKGSHAPAPAGPPRLGRFGVGVVTGSLPPAGSTTGTLTSWLPFRSAPPPPIGADETGVDNGNVNEAEVAQLRAYAWGKRGADWTRAGRWIVRFDDRFDGSGGVRTTAVSSSPWPDENAAVAGVGNGGWNTTRWSMSFSTERGTLLDPSGRAALASGCIGSACTLYALAEGQPVQQLRDASGKPTIFGRPSTAVRVGETWYFLVPSQGNESLTLYRVELGVAQRLTVLHRSSLSRNVPGPQLVRRARSEALGVLAGAAPEPGERVGAWFVMPVNLETGELGEPINLGRKDFGGKVPARCTPAQDGWLFDAQSDVTTPVDFQGASGTAEPLELRVRADPGSACVESMATRLDSFTNGVAAHAAPGPKPGHAGAAAARVAIDDRAAIPLAATEKPNGRRWSLRCAAKIVK